MTSSTIQILLVIAAYLIGCIVLGLVSSRKAQKASAADYLLASREFKFFILFSAIFGANISAVTLVGVPGTAYHVGWVVWAYFATSWAWFSPLLFYTVGNKAWVLCGKFNVMTISDLFEARWHSKGIKLLTSAFFAFYLIPYLMVGVIGGGKTFEGLTAGAVPYWLGGLIVVLVTCSYVFFGGMRGAAWVNGLQTVVFLAGGFAIFLVIVYSLGGFGETTQTIAEKYPALLDRSKMPWQRFFSFGLVVSLAVPCFPNVFGRLLTGSNPSQLKKTCIIYPVAGIFLFVLMAYCGMWGHIPFPDLKGAASDKILPMLLAKYAPAWMAGVLAAAIFSALMSTLDSQFLALGQMVIKDFVIPFRKDKNLKKSDVVLSKALVLIFAAIAYIASMFDPKAIITIIDWSFGGFACMFMPLIVCLYWRRVSVGAIYVSVIVSQFLSIGIPLGLIPKASLMGFLPALWAMVGGAVVLFICAFIFPAQPREETDKFFA
jgi:solute:Na+ symporter, SSS family